MDYIVVYVCFFKQKTAYEMRISDWSSDVCSSDLCQGACDRPALARPGRRGQTRRRGRRSGAHPDRRRMPHHRVTERGADGAVRRTHAGQGTRTHRRPGQFRSEEHTSELQSLMRISYAVFCLKKKTESNTTNMCVTDVDDSDYD